MICRSTTQPLACSPDVDHTNGVTFSHSTDYLLKLSPSAYIFYNAWRVSPNNTEYNIVFDQLLYGELCHKRLHQACNRYISEHLLLNSHIKIIDGIAYWGPNSKQYSMTYDTVPITDDAILSFANQPFDLFHGPLYRLKLISIKPLVHRFVIVLHHIVIDGPGVKEGLIYEISRYYNKLDYKTPLTHSSQATALIRLDKSMSKSQDLCHHPFLNLWRDQTSKLEPVSLDFLHTSAYLNSDDPATHAMASLHFSYPRTYIDRLTQVKDQYEHSTYTFGLTLFALLLYRYSGCEKFAISFPKALFKNSSFVLGAQISMCFIPLHFDQYKTVKELFTYTSFFFKELKKLKPAALNFFLQQMLQEHGQHVLSTCYSQTSLKHVFFDFDGIDHIEKSKFTEIDFVSHDRFIFEQELTQTSLNHRIRYDMRYIDKNLIESFAAQYQKQFHELLEILISNPDKLLTSFTMLTNDEKSHQQRITSSSCNIFDNQLPLHAHFECIASRYPDRIALVLENKSLSYQHLNTLSNQLAFYLHSLQPEPSSPYIVICMENSIDLITVILSILKLGYAYVTINPHQPTEYIEHVIKDVDAALMITSHTYKENLKALHHKVICLDDILSSDLLAHLPSTNPNFPMNEMGIAYVIYTSGTTGMPKGVMQTHHNVLALFDSGSRIYDFDSNDVWMMLHHASFDFSVWELWGALLHGGKLLIPSHEQITDMHMLSHLCIQQHLTILNITPQLFYQFCQYIHEHHLQKYLYPHLKYVIFGGEKLDFYQLRKWYQHGESNIATPQLVNMYGITETCVHSSYKFIAPHEIHRKSIIGKALPHQIFYILDKHRDPVPIGATGELYIGGIGLALGYMNQEALTSQRFIHNPFQSPIEQAQNINARLYRTGDLVRQLPDGELLYIGRNDSQIKVRGFRIESESIQLKLLNYREISRAIITTNHPTNDTLIAYYVAKNPLDASLLDKYMKSHLPLYMCPGLYIHLNDIPTTANGKIDYKSLSLCISKNNTTNSTLHAQGNLEQLICQAFSMVLGIENISRSSDFFLMGGNSIKAIELVAILKQYFMLSVTQIYQSSTPMSLAAVVSRQTVSLSENLYTIIERYKTMSGGLSQKAFLKVEQYVNQAVYIRTKAYALARKTSKRILLTGSTGYLGCYLLHHILTHTQHTLYLLIRAHSQKHAIERIINRYKYYFGEDIQPLLNARVYVIPAELSEPNFNLTPKQYQNLTQTIDTIIHAAALVKHFGEEQHFISANILTTKNIILFAQQTPAPNIHYISTISTCYMSAENSNQSMVYTEDDLPSQLNFSKNLYVKTKLATERLLMDTNNVDVSIYRVGNLAFDSRGKTQKNKNDNAFLNFLNFLTTNKSIAQEIAHVEISMVDKVAEAIITLFNQPTDGTKNHDIYHVFNPYKVNLISMLETQWNDIRILSIEEMVEQIKTSLLDFGSGYPLLLRFMLYLGWLEGDINLHHCLGVTVLQNRTQTLLHNIGFDWEPISADTFQAYFQSNPVCEDILEKESELQ